MPDSTDHPGHTPPAPGHAPPEHSARSHSDPGRSDPDRVDPRPHADSQSALQDQDASARLLPSPWLHRIIEQTKDLISLHDAEGRYLYASPSFEAVLGYAPDALIDQSAFALIHPDDHAQASQKMAEALAGKSVRFEYRVLRPDGTPIWVETAGNSARLHQPSSEDHPTPFRIFAITRPVEQRKRSEQALRRSQAQLRAERKRLELALLGGDLGLWDCNYVTGSQYVSDRWATMLGYEAGAVGTTFDSFIDLVHPEDFDALVRALEMHVNEGSPYLEREIRMRAADGSWRWVLSRGRVVEWTDDGLPRRAIGTHVDITERKRQEQALQRAKEQAEEAARLKSALLANMSHEVRTPLTSIVGFAEVLANECADPKQRHFASLIKRSSERLRHTLSSMLQLSRLEAGRITPAPALVDLCDLLTDIRDEYATHARTSGVTLHVDAPASLPVCTDREMIWRILANLVSNALKFTPDGGRVTVQAQVAVAASQHAWHPSTSHASRPAHFAPAHGVWIVVADTGIGMSPAFQARMFDAFEQESAGHARRHEGSGLGLAIVKRLVDRLHGTILVDSVRHQGTQIHVGLPSLPDDAS